MLKHYLCQTQNGNNKFSSFHDAKFVNNNTAGNSIFTDYTFIYQCTQQTDGDGVTKKKPLVVKLFTIVKKHTEMQLLKMHVNKIKSTCFIGLFYTTKFIVLISVQYCKIFYGHEINEKIWNFTICSLYVLTESIVGSSIISIIITDYTSNASVKFCTLYALL